LCRTSTTPCARDNEDSTDVAEAAGAVTLTVLPNCDFATGEHRFGIPESVAAEQWSTQHNSRR